MKSLKLVAVPILLGIFLTLLSAKTADISKQTERIDKAASVLKDFGKMKEKIPRELLEDCEGIVIIPRLFNAGFAIGGKYGKGLAMVKTENGRWSDPVFVTLTGGSFGLQFGIQSVDLVLIFKHKGMLTKVKNGDFTIGGDVSAAAGPVGRSASANTDYKLQAEVYSYSRSRGLFGGITINGSNLGIDKKSNLAYYGKDATTQDIFETSKSNTEAVKLLKESLEALK
jgi:lipid-binding SYLF domain-containing protein